MLVTGDLAAEQAGPGEEHNPGPPSTPRQAATVILLRGGSESLEVLLVKRTPNARFMGGVWVFPGGALEREESAAADAHRRAARRELKEEAGVALRQDAELIEFSRWITPEEVKIRFDTRFFLAELPEGAQVTIDGQECVEHRWTSPSCALSAHGAGEMMLVFPTIKHLERLAAFDNVTDLLRHSRGREVVAVQPRVVLEGEVARVVLPGEPRRS